MANLMDMKPPANLDWQSWVDSWDRMQERYLVRRTERFKVIERMIRGTQQTVAKVVDLGCGTGSLMLSVLDAFPRVEILGFDFDPTMLWLAKARLKQFGSRSQIALVDLREPSWTQSVSSSVDAVISATALHWLSSTQLNELYHGIAQILKPGGIFLNADHVSSDLPEIQ